jgi:hypothetical protein
MAASTERTVPFAAGNMDRHSLSGPREPGAVRARLAMGIRAPYATVPGRGLPRWTLDSRVFAPNL